MNLIEQPAQSTRLLSLMAELRWLRHEADRFGASDTVHQLRNYLMTAQSALALVQTRLNQGRTDQIVDLLNLAAGRLRDGRVLVARTQRTRFGLSHRVALAAA